MPVLACPNCGAFVPRLLDGSQVLDVNYYRCGECAHVWTADKVTHEVLTHVTPLIRKPPTKKP